MNGNIVKNGEDNSHIIEILKILGYTHKGFSLDFNGIQPDLFLDLILLHRKKIFLKTFLPKQDIIFELC